MTDKKLALPDQLVNMMNNAKSIEERIEILLHFIVFLSSYVEILIAESPVASKLAAELRKKKSEEIKHYLLEVSDKGKMMLSKSKKDYEKNLEEILDDVYSAIEETENKVLKIFSEKN